MDDDADDVHPLVFMVLPGIVMVAIAAVGFVVALTVRGSWLWLPLFVLLVGGGLGLMVLLAPAASSLTEDSQDAGRETD